MRNDAECFKKPIDQSNIWLDVISGIILYFRYHLVEVKTFLILYEEKNPQACFELLTEHN